MQGSSSKSRSRTLRKTKLQKTFGSRSCGLARQPNAHRAGKDICQCKTNPPNGEKDPEGQHVGVLVINWLWARFSITSYLELGTGIGSTAVAYGRVSLQSRRSQKWLLADGLDGKRESGYLEDWLDTLFGRCWTARHVVHVEVTDTITSIRHIIQILYSFQYQIRNYTLRINGLNWPCFRFNLVSNIQFRFLQSSKMNWSRDSKVPVYMNKIFDIMTRNTPLWY